MTAARLLSEAPGQDLVGQWPARWASLWPDLPGGGPILAVPSAAAGVGLAVLMLVLLAALLAGLWRVLRGPSHADRMLAAQLFGTTGVAILVLMALAGGIGALLDVALTLAVLAAVSVVAFVASAGPGGGGGRAP